MKKHLYLFTTLIVLLLAACNKDEVITGQAKPVIKLDNPEGVYTLKVGKSVTISPTVEHAGKAVYAWLLDGRQVGSEATYTYEAAEAGTYYLVFRVENSGGSAQEELRIDVSELLPPVISFAVGEDKVLTLEAGRDNVIAPEIANGDGASFEWLLDGKTVGTEAAYTFSQTRPGDYPLTLRAENEDGRDEQSIVVRVVDRFEVTVTFPAPYYAPGADCPKSVSLGRTLYLQPYTEHFRNPSYAWSVDGAKTDASGSIFAFTPKAQGSYSIAVTVTDPDGAAATKTVKVTCYGSEASHMRPATGTSQRHANTVFEYIAAPGQFVPQGAGSTVAEAAAFAQKQLRASADGYATYVSLGAWGGYIVAGFDHSVENRQGYDFSIAGNQFKSSSEPGIVWVMQDTDGNGKPDDEWYELKGSEYGKPETVQQYAMTYYRPAGDNMGIQWRDNQGNTGTLPVNAFHTQGSYYPSWIGQQSYTLYGTKLKSRTRVQPNGEYYNGEFDWGYADNVGSDNTDGDNPEAGPMKTFFDIANAVNADGSPANLKYIDFIKVQTGVYEVSGDLGELSTEVFGFEDEHL